MSAAAKKPHLPEAEVFLTEEPVRHAQTIRAGPHVIVADEPESMGGKDTGPAPYDLFLSGLGACTSMTIRMYADRKGWPLEGVKVRLKHSKVPAEECAACEATTGFVSRIEREIELTGGLDEEQRARLLDIADRCPVHRTVVEEKEMVTTLAGA